MIQKGITVFNPTYLTKVTSISNIEVFTHRNFSGLSFKHQI